MRVVRQWNRLSNGVAVALSLEIFKSQLNFELSYLIFDVSFALSRRLD